MKKQGNLEKSIWKKSFAVAGSSRSSKAGLFPVRGLFCPIWVPLAGHWGAYFLGWIFLFYWL